ncbi:NADH dehydrogenase [ubiquinone] iron-sulfur protein 6, mitochondrial-like [Watersipora subatra]|uniref:NADH dehydrogenase [ubiquinone] iron-sulfur protein 6, mitochondrial-like n=1 Tax=Watersipora subatra TaxID=2589382 RepID=UPI00355B0C65
MATALLKVCQTCVIKCRNNIMPKRFLSLSAQNRDKQTHTGQSWSDGDQRLVRFLDGKEKQVNERFAIDLIAEQAPRVSTKRVVSCDGGGGPLGHPKVFINLDQPGNHTCGYCGLRFTKEGHH